jgi:hypothetical protein
VAVCSLVNWPVGVREKNPASVLPLCFLDSSCGFYAWRNRWQDSDDTVITVLSNPTRMRRDGNMADFGNLSLYCAHPAEFDLESFPWSHDNGGHEATQGARLTIRAERGEFVTVLYPGRMPPTRTVPGGVQVGDDEILFHGDIETDISAAGASGEVVTVTRKGRQATALAARDIDLDRSQGDVGLFVPDAGYPFGEIPDWLIRQRCTVPDWAPSWARQARQYDRKQGP